MGKALQSIFPIYQTDLEFNTEVPDETQDQNVYLMSKVKYLWNVC
jgi:hypothetical protein